MKNGFVFGGLLSFLVAAGFSWSLAGASPQAAAHQSTTRVIVELEKEATPSLATVDARIESVFTSLGFAVVRVPPDRLEHLQRLPGVRRVTLDREIRTDTALPLWSGHDDEAAPADLAVAVLNAREQGAAPCHPAGQVVVEGVRTDQKQPAAGKGPCLEVVPGAPTWEIQALDGDGRARLSEVLAALDWVARQAESRRIRILAVPFHQALSLPHDDGPLVTAAARLWDRGVAVVVPDPGAVQRGRQELTSLR